MSRVSRVCGVNMVSKVSRVCGVCRAYPCMV